MKSPRLPLALTLINLALLAVLLWQVRAPAAATRGTDPAILRGRALEIVDDQGRVRASITVLPPNPTATMPSGAKGFPETVILRLIDFNGRPEVKLAASEQGGAIGFVGDNDATQVHLEAKGAESSLNLTNKDGPSNAAQAVTDPACPPRHMRFDQMWAVNWREDA